MKKFLVGTMVKYFSRILYNNFPRKNLIDSCNWKYLDVFLKRKTLIKISYSLKNNEGPP